METLFEFSPLVIAVIPVIVGLVEVVKSLGLDSKYAPVVSLVMGIGLVSLTGVVWQAALLQGIISGLAASGLFSSAKRALE